MKRIISFFIIFGLLANISIFYSFSVSKPQAVKSIKLTKTCPTAVKIKWSKSLGASKYLVYAKAKGGKFKKIANTSSKSCIAESLKKNIRYTFKIIPYTLYYDSKILGKSKSKSIDLSTAKTKTPYISYSDYNSILHCVVRIMNIGAYVDYDPAYVPPKNIGWYNNKNYRLVTTKGLKTIKDARKRMKNFLVIHFTKKLLMSRFWQNTKGVCIYT